MKKVPLQVIILWPFNHNAANRTSLGALVSETLFFEWPYIFFTSDQKKNKKNRVCYIKKVKTGLGTFACRHMLFLYVILGCDTTFCLFSIGKGTVLKKFKDDVALQ